MPFKSKEQRRVYNREYARLRRAGQPLGSRRVAVTYLSNPPRQTESAKGLLGVLSYLISEVIQTSEGDIFIRARTAGYLISIGLRAVEVADLEHRIELLEAKLGG